MTAEKLMRARCNNKKDESLYPIVSIETSQNVKEYIGSKKFSPKITIQILLLFGLVQIIQFVRWYQDATLQTRLIPND